MNRSALSRAHAAAPSLHVPDGASCLARPEHWDVYARVIRQARAAGVDFAIGGGMAVALHTGMWRPGKDIDLYVVPADRDAAVAATRDAGLTDLYDVHPYDRAWIYRASGEGVIVDVIWALANRFGEVDRSWLDAAVTSEIGGERLAVLGPVELIWSKLHVLQRDRCDWPDLLNLLYACGSALDWRRLIDGLPGDEALLAALLTLFGWVAPGRAAEVPAWVFDDLGVALPRPGRALDRARIARLDTRPWFHPGL